MKTIGERIKRCRLLKSWSLAELARQVAAHTNGELTVTPENLGRIEAGKNGPGDDLRKALAGLFRVSEVYLEFGITHATNGKGPTEEEMEMLESYRRCNPEIRRVVDVLLQTGAMPKGK